MATREPSHIAGPAYSAGPSPRLPVAAGKTRESPPPARSLRRAFHRAGSEDLEKGLERLKRHHALMQEWMPVLNRLRLPVDEAQRAASRALANGTGFAAELLVSRIVDEASLFRAIAAELGLPFLAAIEPSRLQIRERHRLAVLGGRDGPPAVQMQRRDGSALYVLARADIGIAATRARLVRMPELAMRLCIAPPGVLRAAILTLTRGRLLFDARYDLFLHEPDFSARFVANAWQGACVGAFLAALPFYLAFAGQQAVLALHIAATAGFLACIALRILALGSARPLRLRDPPPVDPAELPVYSVLVALYRERDVIPQLLVALGKIQWPRAKLEIRLVCEQDDHETLEALRAYDLRHFAEVVEVPPGAPRTKPKALAYALPLCSGEFVTLFDAEDRPHPLQLVEAWRRFRAEDEGLACVQAPLVITNGAASPLSRMFAFEYAGLFRGLLPWLAAMNVVLPLGGTSNHFRRAALMEAGGWDAHNVTEDADLGLRLKRFGYRVGVITLPTLEDAPEDLRAWLPQRVRWFKGWAQTWLVHMRSPRALWRDLGPVSFLTMQVLFLGMLVSALAHPLFLLTILYVIVRLVLFGTAGTLEAVMVAIGTANIIAGYGAFIAIGAATLSTREKATLGTTVLLTPVHWVLLSVAAWLALWEIWRRPHHWNKTPHRPTRSFVRAGRGRAGQPGAGDGGPTTGTSSPPAASGWRPS